MNQFPTTTTTVKNLALSAYNYTCTYESINNSPETKLQKCETVAKGVCNFPGHYINFFKIYYCKFEGSDPVYITFCIVATIWLLLMMNFIRRSFYVSPLFQLRKLLGVNGRMAEITIVPFAYGIVPFIVRGQAAWHNIPYKFNIAASLGGMFALTAFVIGISSLVIGKSKKVNKVYFVIDVIFGILACVLYGLICAEERVSLIQGVVFVMLWMLYLLINFFFEKKVPMSKFFF